MVNGGAAIHRDACIMTLPAISIRIAAPRLRLTQWMNQRNR